MCCTVASRPISLFKFWQYRTVLYNSAWSRQVAGRVGVCMICSGRASGLGLRILCPSSSVRCLVEVLRQVLRQVLR